MLIDRRAITTYLHDEPKCEAKVAPYQQETTAKSVSLRDGFSLALNSVKVKGPYVESFAFV